MAVALNQTVYLWNASSGDIQELLSAQGDDYVTSLSWAADGKHVAVGFSNALTQIWDAERCKPVRNLGGHAARVSSLSWNQHILSTGGRDSLILNHDVRVREHVTATLRGHAQEVCGLKWSPNGTQVRPPRTGAAALGGWAPRAGLAGAVLGSRPPNAHSSPRPAHTLAHTSAHPPTPLPAQLASGGNDNLLMIWDAASDRAAHRITAHQAAVKALAWCPFQANLLATGGGTADRTIKFHNTHTGAGPGRGGRRLFLVGAEGCWAMAAWCVRAGQGALASKSRAATAGAHHLPPFSPRPPPAGALLNSIDTGSQVCSLQWNRHERELLSSHGFRWAGASQGCSPPTAGAATDCLPTHPPPVPTARTHSPAPSCLSASAARTSFACGSTLPWQRWRSSRGTPPGCCTWPRAPTAPPWSAPPRTRRCASGAASASPRARRPPRPPSPRPPPAP